MANRNENKRVTRQDKTRQTVKREVEVVQEAMMRYGDHLISNLQRAYLTFFA